MRTLEQQRAADALRRTTELSQGPDGFKTSYRSYANALGPTILVNGLGQALASEKAAAGSNPSNDREKAHDVLYRNVERWLCRERGVYSSRPDLLDAIVGGDETLYLLAQAEALAWLEWHKKFCRSYLPASDGRTE